MCVMKKLSYTVLLTATLLAMGLSSCSGNDEYNFYSTLYGTVSDSESGNPINAATIVLSPGGKTTVSGADGRYEFSDLDVSVYEAQGHVQLTAKATGISAAKKN